MVVSRHSYHLLTDGRYYQKAKEELKDVIIEEGMVFTIEPGIYLGGKFGVRLENIVAVIRGVGELTFGEAIEEIIQKKHSKKPLYSKSPDHITGILYVKDIVPLYANLKR